MKKGDLVRLRSSKGVIAKGALGRVHSLDNFGNVGVRWQQFKHGHQLGTGTGPSNGWWVSRTDLVVVRPKKPAKKVR